MDLTSPARRPWWKRKRWAAAMLAAAMALPPVLYVAAEGPVLYAVGRRWLPLGAYNLLYAPVRASAEPALPVEWRIAHVRYCRWWADLANPHPAAPD